MPCHYLQPLRPSADSLRWLGCVPPPGLVSALRCIGISYMPGSVYVIISTADLPINTMLSRFVLKKQFAPLQVRASDFHSHMFSLAHNIYSAVSIC